MIRVLKANTYIIYKERSTLRCKYKHNFLKSKYKSVKIRYKSLIKEFQRLKEDEQHRLSLEWSLQRTLSDI